MSPTAQCEPFFTCALFGGSLSVLNDDDLVTGQFVLQLRSLSPWQYGTIFKKKKKRTVDILITKNGSQVFCHLQSSATDSAADATNCTLYSLLYLELIFLLMALQCFPHKFPRVFLTVQNDSRISVSYKLCAELKSLLCWFWTIFLALNGN